MGGKQRRVRQPATAKMTSSPLDSALQDFPALEDLLKCTICMERYQDPRLLHCGHTFCLNCLERLRTSTHWTRSLTCPVCRKATPMSSGGVAGLQRDFRVSQIHDAFSAVTVSSPHASRHCDICLVSGQRKDGTFSCLQCKKRLCSECLDRHRRQQQFRSHTLVKADPDMATVMCREHDENCTHLCQACHKLVCVTCMLVTCSSHTCLEVGLAVRDMAGQVERLHANLEERLVQVTDCLAAHEQITAAKTKLFDDTEAEIKKHTTKLIRIVQENSRNLLEELDTIRTKTLDSLSVSRVEANESLRVLGALRQVSSGVTESAIAPQLLAVLPSLSVLSRTSWRPSTPPTISVEFRQEANLAVGLLRSQKDPGMDLGDPVAEVDLEGAWCPPGPSATPSPSAPVLEEASSDLAIRSYHSKTIRGLRGGWGAAILPDDSLAISDCTMNKVVLHALEEGHRAMADSRLQNVTLQGPHGLAYHPERSQLYVVCKEDGTLAMLDPSDLSLVRRIQLKVQSPCGLAVLRNGQLVISEVSPRRHGLSIHDVHGRHIRSWGARSAANQSWFTWKAENVLFDGPQFVATDDHGRILVADHNRSEVQVFDTSGHLLLRFGDPATLGHPSGIAVDHRDNILVAYSRDQSEAVAAFSPDGFHIATPVEWSRHDSPGQIRGLAVSQGSCFSVVSEYEAQVHTYCYGAV